MATEISSVSRIHTKGKVPAREKLQDTKEVLLNSPLRLLLTMLLFMLARGPVESSWNVFDIMTSSIPQSSIVVHNISPLGSDDPRNIFSIMGSPNKDIDELGIPLKFTQQKKLVDTLGDSIAAGFLERHEGTPPPLSKYIADDENCKDTNGGWTYENEAWPGAETSETETQIETFKQKMKDPKYKDTDITLVISTGTNDFLKGMMQPETQRRLMDTGDHLQGITGDKPLWDKIGDIGPIAGGVFYGADRIKGIGDSYETKLEHILEGIVDTKKENHVDINRVIFIGSPEFKNLGKNKEGFDFSMLPNGPAAENVSQLEALSSNPLVQETLSDILHYANKKMVHVLDDFSQSKGKQAGIDVLYVDGSIEPEKIKGTHPTEKGYRELAKRIENRFGTETLGKPKRNENESVNRVPFLLEQEIWKRDSEDEHSLTELKAV